VLGASGQAGEWKVLVMDALATHVVASVCQMTDILDAHVSCVEDIGRARQALPGSPAVYLMAPSRANALALVDDFAGERGPLYRDAHVFFTSAAPPAVLDVLRAAPGLTQRLRGLREAHMEFSVVDSRTFSTMHPYALQHLYQDRCDQPPHLGNYRGCLDHVAMRLACALATLGEHPAIRYQAPAAVRDGDPGSQQARYAVSQAVAEALHVRLGHLAQALGGQLPAPGSCDLLVVDRSLDPVAPVYHPWTYEAMAHDLLLGDGNVYEHVQNTGEGVKSRTVKLDESDELFVELRHLFIGDAYRHVAERNARNLERSRVQRLREGHRDGSLKMSDLQAAAQALPGFAQASQQVALHLDVAGKLHRYVEGQGLKDVGALEQELMGGAAGHKELSQALERHRQLTTEERVRLLTCYYAAHPDDRKAKRWAQESGLGPGEMQIIRNLELLGMQVAKQGRRFLQFSKKARAAPRGAQNVAEGEFVLMRAQPLLHERITEAVEGTLSEEQFPWVVPPPGGGRGGGAGGGWGAPPGAPAAGAAALSARTVRGAHSVGWAQRVRAREQERAAGAGAGDRDRPRQQRGRRLIVFVVGGVCHAEVRAAHVLSQQLGRDILLGSTGVVCPSTYLRQLGALRQGGSD